MISGQTRNAFARRSCSNKMLGRRDGRRYRRQNRRPYAKASRRCACQGGRRQEPGGQHLVHHRGRHADIVDLLGIDRRRHPDAAAQPDRQCGPASRRRRGAARARQHVGLCRARRDRRAAVDAGDRRDRRQHDPAPAGMVVGIADAEIQQGIARRRTETHLRQAGGGEFRQGRVQADRARRRHDGGAVARAPSPGIVPDVRSFGDPRRHHQSDTAIDGRGGGDAGRGRDRRLLLPVPAMVPAAEDVAAGDQGRVQAVRRRPPHQGPRSGSCASSA